MRFTTKAFKAFSTAKWHMNAAYVYRPESIMS